MRKRCWKTVLSAILASAMLFTSVPTNLSMTVHAQEPSVEDTLSVLTELDDENEPTQDDQTGQGSDEDQNAKNLVGGGTNVVNTTEDEGGDDAGSDQTSGTQTGNAEDNKTPDVDDNNEAGGGQIVPTVDATTGAEVNDDKTVTFTCVASEITFKDWDQSGAIVGADALTNLVAKGGRSGEGWAVLATLTKDENGVWTGTSSALAPGTYSWKFASGNNIYESVDGNDSKNRELAITGMNDTTINVVRGVETELDAQIDGINVEYSLTSETTAADTENAIQLSGSAGSQKLTVGAAWDVSKNFTMTATQVGGSETCTVTVKVAASELKEDENGKLPVIDSEKGEVTFYYFAPSAGKVTIKGEMTGSTWPSEEMTYDSTTGYWEKTITMGPGSYEYGFEVDGVWAVDSKQLRAANQNNIVIVPGLVNGEAPDAVLGGAAVELPETLKLFKEYVVTDDTSKQNVTAETTDETVTYSIPADATWKDKVTLTPATADKPATVAVKSDFPTDVKSFDLIASAGDETSKVTVNVVSTMYTYTIYYYDTMHEMSTDAVDLWLWENGGGGGNIAVPFTEKEELADDREWLKATVELSFTSLGMKSRTKGSWDGWQDGVDRTYNNAEGKEEVTLYYVFGQPLTDTLPEIKEEADRYLVVEYTRTTQTDQDWFFYTWNSGYGNSFVPFEDEDNDGTGTALVPVMAGVDSISFCLERTNDEGEHWGEKDGNDYNCPMPADQNVVKIKMEEGKGITYTYPYNTGYEIDTKEKKINFYYRDDEAFLAGAEGGYEDVTLELIAPKADDAKATADDQEETSSVQTAKMTYDAEEQRYEWTLEQLVPGDHYYRYARKKTAEDTAEYVLDDFNELKETVAESEYSVLKYDLLDVEMEAEMQNATMDYNDNNVLKIKINAKDSEGEPIENTDELKVVDRATVDLGALGGSVVEIDPELLAVTIAVKQGTSVGEKTLPITIYDVYNNEYKTEAKVTVVDRSKGSDFDWDEAVVYFAVTDRFFDGNSSNNDGGVPGSYDPDTNGGLNSSYHGGDFAGLTQKLDYLQDLGVNTIWITPIVENQTVANSVDDPTVTQAWGYTGYWAKDFTKLDSHLGTEAEFSALLDAAHAKGMKVMVDVVLNHTGYGDEITDYYNTNFKNEDGEVIRMLRGNDEIVSGSDQMSSLSGLPDFRTEDPEVRELIVEWQSNWISRYPIDYYRVDTVKHVDATTWSAFKNALTEINPDFKMIGEWAGGGYGTDTGMLNTGRMDSLLDFDFNDKALSFITGDISGTESFLTARNASIDNTASLGAFLSSHDEDGFVFKLTDTRDPNASDSDKKGYGYMKSPEEAEALAMVAASLQFTAKGQVIIYYGEEIGESDGQENYPYQTNRKDFNWSAVNADNKTLAHYKKMLAIRNMYSELFAKGTRNTISADNANGLDVFTRSYGGTTLTVALNIKDQAQTYTLSGQTPGTALVDYYSGAQFVVDESGNAVITIPAAADGGTVVLGTENFRIDLPAGGMQIKSIPDQTYTGLSIKLPEDVLQVYDGTTRLTAGVDYSVSYKNNKAIGTATVMIKGKGNYKDTETAQFNIVPKNIAELDIDYKDVLIANNSVQKPLTKITNNGKKLTTKEYQVEYYQVDESGNRTSAVLKGVKDVGEYQMVITGLKNYTGTVTKEISVKETGTYMSKLQITLEYTSKAYTGAAIEPEVEVKSGSNAVEEDCYTVSYSNNVNVGTANVIITGVSAKGYYGSVTKTFKITGTQLSKVAQVDTKSWQAKVAIDPITGNAQQPNAVLTAKKGQSVSLSKGKDYTVSYSNNTKPGTATVTFTGAGQYTGSIKKTFKIAAIAWKQDDLGKNLVVTVSETAPYSKKGSTAGVVVTYKNKRLAEGKDYKLTYKNNKTVTAEDLAENKKPSVEITGMGSFSGKIKAGTFKIVKADLNTAGITLTVPDAVYTDQNGSFISKPVVKEADGTMLAEGTNKDYTVAYYAMDNGNWVEKTSNDAALDANARMKVVVTGAGNYTGEVSKEYRVVAASIRKATIIAKAQTYTGKEITLDANDFSKARIGKNDLEYGVDYEIVPGSYEKNVNKGNATVTIRGIGNYGDEKKVTFRITSSVMRWWWNLFS